MMAVNNALAGSLILVFAAVGTGDALAQPGDAADIVRREIQALNAGDAAGVLQTFDRDALLFQLPTLADRLVGDLPQHVGAQPPARIYAQHVLAKELLPRISIMDSIEVGDLVAVKLRTVHSVDPEKVDYSLFIYKTARSRISAVWHAARASADPQDASKLEVIRRLVTASNEANVEQFVANFSSDARLFKSSGRMHALADQPIERLSGESNLQRAIAVAFAEGARSRTTIIAAFTFGDLVVSHDRVVVSNGAVLNQLKVYRIREGRITHDWSVYEG